jgi:hypothetical protein
MASFIRTCAVPFLTHTAGPTEVTNKTCAQNVASLDVNSTGNGAFRDVGHILHQGALCLINGIRFYAARLSVRSLTPLRENGLHCANFTNVSKAQQRYVLISYTEFHPDRSVNVARMDRNSFTFHQ